MIPARSEGLGRGDRKTVRRDHVQFDDAFQPIDLFGEHRPPRPHAGIVDKERDGIVRAQAVLDAANIAARCQVCRQHVDLDAGFRRKPACQVVQTLLGAATKTRSKPRLAKRSA